MWIWLFPLAVADFCLLGLRVLYHLYSGFRAGCFTSFGLVGLGAPGRGNRTLMDLRKLLTASVVAAVPRCIR